MEFKKAIKEKKLNEIVTWYDKRILFCYLQ
jgi:hypothetical protein